MTLVTRHHELRVYHKGFEAAQRIFDLSRHWPSDERYALTGQIRRSSRAVCANIAEAWRKRLYVPNFVSKVSDVNAEAAETSVWLDFARQCGYLEVNTHAQLSQTTSRSAAAL